MTGVPVSQVELKRIAEAIEAGDVLTVEQRRNAASALRLAALPQRFADRDALLLAIRREFFAGHTDNDAAHEIAAGLGRYMDSAWRRDRVAPTCPDRIAGSVKGAYWRVLQAVPRPLSVERIRKIVGHLK